MEKSLITAVSHCFKNEHFWVLQPSKNSMRKKHKICKEKWSEPQTEIRRHDNSYIWLYNTT